MNAEPGGDLWSRLEEMTGPLSEHDRGWVLDLIRGVQALRVEPRQNRQQALASLEEQKVRGRPRKARPLAPRVRNYISAALPDRTHNLDPSWENVLQRAGHLKSRRATPEELRIAKDSAACVVVESEGKYFSRPFPADSDKNGRSPATMDWPRYFVIVTLAAAWGRRLRRARGEVGPGASRGSNSGSVPPFVRAVQVILHEAGRRDSLNEIKDAILKARRAERAGRNNAL